MAKASRQRSSRQNRPPRSNQRKQRLPETQNAGSKRFRPGVFLDQRCEIPAGCKRLLLEPEREVRPPQAQAQAWVSRIHRHDWRRVRRHDHPRPGHIIRPVPVVVMVMMMPVNMPMAVPVSMPMVRSFGHRHLRARQYQHRRTRYRRNHPSHDKAPFVVRAVLETALLAGSSRGSSSPSARSQRRTRANCVNPMYAR
jgi:hypothetical protein